MATKQLRHWKLSTISNIILLLLYLIGSVTLVLRINISTKQQALKNAERYATMILDRNVITHAYFNKVLKGSLYELTDGKLSNLDWMSSTFAINSITEDYGLFTEEELFYKEAAINARNPANEATSDEQAFIKKSNADDELKTTSAIQDYASKPFFVVLHRGQKVTAQCLFCHGDPADAPKQISEHYGETRGFNHQLGETISAISIRIPLAMAYQEADRLSLQLSGFLLGVLLVIFTLHYVVSRQLLFSPLNTLQQKISKIASDPEKLGDTLPLPVGRELSRMVESFNLMSQNLRSYNDNQEETIRERTAELTELQHHNELILNTAGEGLLGLDIDGNITFMNRSATEMLGIQSSQSIGSSVYALLASQSQKPDRPEAGDLIKEVLRRGERLSQKEAVFKHSNGQNFSIEFSCAPIRENGIKGAVISFNDITQRKLSEQEIQNLAFYDQLTGLPNRTLFYDRINQQVATALRDYQKIALMFLDLDDFKMVNDTLGHAAGDDFLKEIARRLREASRQADTIARLGGDEFVWFGEIIDEDDAKRVAVKFLESIARPVRLGEHNFNSTVSIGIALFPESAEDVSGLMKCADIAMYEVKQKSKNAYRFYRRHKDS